MSTQTELARHSSASTPQTGNGQAAQRSSPIETALRPPVDIWEDKDGITVCADMPGVSKDRLNVRVDGNTLLVEGQLQLELAGDAEALYADLRSSLYRRSFALSGELDTEKIAANLKDGVLTVHIPKRAEHRPRKIEVKVA
jgi:HSP20 family protein